MRRLEIDVRKRRRPVKAPAREEYTDRRTVRSTQASHLASISYFGGTISFLSSAIATIVRLLPLFELTEANKHKNRRLLPLALPLYSMADSCCFHFSSAVADVLIMGPGAFLFSGSSRPINALYTGLKISIYKVHINNPILYYCTFLIF